MAAPELTFCITTKPLSFRHQTANAGRSVPAFRAKKPPSRRYKEEYCDSCFYRGQPEPPAGLNHIKNRRDSKRERVKNWLSCPIPASPLPMRRCLRRQDFARKKTRHLSERTEQSVLVHRLRQTGRLQHGSDSASAWKKNAVQQAGKRRGRQKNGSSGTGGARSKSDTNNNQFMSPLARHTMIIGTHRPGIRAAGIFLFTCHPSRV